MCGRDDSIAFAQDTYLLGLDAGCHSLFADAVSAYEKATVLVTDDAMAWSALGEALVMASKRDPMPTKALAAFRRAVALDAKDPRARYFLAVKRDIDGDHQGPGIVRHRLPARQGNLSAAPRPAEQPVLAALQLGADLCVAFSRESVATKDEQ